MQGRPLKVSTKQQPAVIQNTARYHYFPHILNTFQISQSATVFLLRSAPTVPCVLGSSQGDWWWTEVALLLLQYFILQDSFLPTPMNTFF